MKKIILILTSTLIMISCKKKDEVVPDNNQIPSINVPTIKKDTVEAKKDTIKIDSIVIVESKIKDLIRSWAIVQQTVQYIPNNYIKKLSSADLAGQSYKIKSDSIVVSFDPSLTLYVDSTSWTKKVSTNQTDYSVTIPIFKYRDYNNNLQTVYNQLLTITAYPNYLGFQILVVGKYKLYTNLIK